MKTENDPGIKFNVTDARTYYLDKDGNEIAPPEPAAISKEEVKADEPNAPIRNSDRSKN